MKQVQKMTEENTCNVFENVSSIEDTFLKYSTAICIKVKLILVAAVVNLSVGGDAAQAFRDS